MTPVQFSSAMITHVFQYKCVKLYEILKQTPEREKHVKICNPVPWICSVAQSSVCCSIPLLILSLIILLLGEL